MSSPLCSLLFSLDRGWQSRWFYLMDNGEDLYYCKRDGRSVLSALPSTQMCGVIPLKHVTALQRVHSSDRDFYIFTRMFSYSLTLLPSQCVQFLTVDNSALVLTLLYTFFLLSFLRRSHCQCEDQAIRTTRGKRGCQGRVAGSTQYCVSPFCELGKKLPYVCYIS